MSNRIENLIALGKYLAKPNAELKNVISLAERNNGWFTLDFIDLSLENICKAFLNPDALLTFSQKFESLDPADLKKVGIVMAGNIPLVGFHDLLCVYLSGHQALVKLSSKDDVLMKHIILKLIEFSEDKNAIQILTMLKECDAYIATGSNHAAQVFKQYFGKYPHIIRKNKTSVAVLTGNETEKDLSLLADDVYSYFGLGCRNVTKIYVPEGYEFVPLLKAFRKYDELKDHNKYRNNLDYQLALFILNNQQYMCNDSIMMVENKSIFSPISILHYEFYSNLQATLQTLVHNEDIQALVAPGYLNFGSSQKPGIENFADDVDTVAFLNRLKAKI